MGHEHYPIVRAEGDRVWKKYCGFLDLSIDEFMSIQEAMLGQQLERGWGSPLWQKLMGKKVPRSLDEFRRRVPLTTYQNYLPELNQNVDKALPGRPHVWAHTSGPSIFRRVPYTLEAYDRALDSLMAVFLLACSKRRGHSSIVEGDRVLFNVAPSPYLSGILASGASDTFKLRAVMPPGTHDNLEFRQKIVRGFETSLRTGVDILIAMTSVLVKMGNDFHQLSRKSSGSRHLAHPKAACRLAQAFLLSRLERRNILPKDLWPVKALIGWGVDTAIYREQVHRDWGAYPYEFHACTEAGILAMQSWTRKDLTFIPYSNYLEFIPETELLKEKHDIFYEPGTLLLNQVKPGERYELVISNFHGMPFLRYRLGHLVRITALADEDAQIYLPQMAFETRADELIDIAGFTRISEKTVSSALAGSGLHFEDWSIRKEMEDGKPILHLYIELREQDHDGIIATVLHSELMKADQGYRDLAVMMQVQPLRVTPLSRGTFGNYYRLRQESGFELAQCRPPRMNASDEVIRQLTQLGAKQALHIG